MSSFQKVKDKSDIVYYTEGNFDKSYEKLPQGIYTIRDAGGLFTEVPCFTPIEEKENLIHFKTGIMGDFIHSVDKFFSKDSIRIYNELKMTHKVGYIFYGKPGTGKTSLCLLAMKILMEKHNCICLDCTGTKLTFILDTIAKIRTHQDNPIVIFYDEVDSMIRSQECDLLPYLDGNKSIDKTIFLGCTNYIQNVPERIRDRKSRIKKCFEISSLPLDVYKEYVKEKISSEKGEIIAKFAYLAEKDGLTIDQLKNAIIDYKLEGMSIEDSIAEAKQLTEVTE